ncbi:MAG: hypothetical protein J6T94_08575 [Bacteroidaceae bacterium]|nr:hypothetical protein [Bacteroidaceae bacterium]
MRRVIYNYSDIVPRLGERTAAAVFRLEDEMERRHKWCFDNYSALDMLNVALALVALLRLEWGMREARAWLKDLHRRATSSDAEAWHRGELVVRLGGMEEEDLLTGYMWQLTATLTEVEELPEWAEEMMLEEMPHYHRSHTAVCTKWTSNNTQQLPSSEGSTTAKKTEQTTVIINVMPGAVYNDIHDNDISS